MLGLGPVFSAFGRVLGNWTKALVQDRMFLGGQIREQRSSSPQKISKSSGPQKIK